MTATTQEPTRIAHFRILGRLGQGGMGVVYRAEDESLRRIVALKLLPDAAGNEERLQRFLREARSAAAISHPNVAVVHQVGQEGGRVFIAMELVPGESLRERLARGPLDLQTARDLAKQIAAGLAAAHEQGIVHRDIKPENVMVTPSGTVKLLDFGLAKGGAVTRSSGDVSAALARTETVVTSDQGRVMGTPDYMSPEQALGEPLDVRSDVFSFGIVLYEMLTGARPFAGASTGAVLVAIARDAPASLEERAPQIDAATAAVVARCLAKSPTDRFADAREILAALEGHSPLALSVAPGEGPAPVRGKAGAARRSRRIVLALLGGLALLAAGVAAVTLRHPPASPVAAPAPASASTSPVAAVLPEGLSRSTSAEAERLFEQALQSFHEGLGQETELLQHAVQIDPAFGGAYLRLSMLAALHGDAERDALYRKAVGLEAGLSPRDRALLDAQDGSDVKRTRDGLDAYLARYPDDDLAWAARQDESAETLARGLAARPGLPLFVAHQAELQRNAGDVPAALATLEGCLAHAPHAVDCLYARAYTLSETGACERAEQDVRRWLEVEPDARAARPLLAGLLASRGAPIDAIREALGDPGRAAISLDIAPETILPMYEGDLAGAWKAATDAAAGVPSSASEWSHFLPAVAAVLAYSEAGVPKEAARVAADYLARRPAWKTPCPPCEAIMVGAAARGGRLDAASAATRLAADFGAVVASGAPPAKAWSATYAYATQTPDEARAAVEKLDALGVSPVGYRASASRALFLAGRGDAARPLLESIATPCTGVFEFTANWARAHLYLGELDERAGQTATACAHYARVVERWGHAKPRSVTADEARDRATRLSCPAPATR